ncbi:hypothetical protein [Companilactobacillus sp. HBUAS59699]|uniref:hypothetical protein n=1 Tax=Companilactobacillus sp. HBUAS59699 TaxID=3109358 RepID=UPI002FEE9382
MEFKNDLDLAAYVAAHSVLSGTYKDLDGNVKVMLPSGAGSALDFDQFRKDTNPSITDTNPPVGADIYPGSLAKGEITERYLLSDIITDPSKVTNLVFQRDVGSKMNMVGDGLQFLVYIQKTVITKGVKGAISRLEINYDPKNVAKNGYYTTTSPVPMYIKGTSFKVDVPVEVPLDGVGENLGLANIKAPSITYTFKSDKSMDVESTQGYANDGVSDGITGVTYDVICEVVSTYSTQEAVTQLPDTVNLFNGSATGEIALAGATDYFENVMDGIEVTLDDYLYGLNETTRISIDQLGISKVIRIPKNYLIPVNKFKINTKYIELVKTNVNYKVVGVNGGNPKQLNYQEKTNSGSYTDKSGWQYYPSSNISALVKMSQGNIDVDISKGISILASGIWLNRVDTYYSKVIKITPYKN